MEICTLFIFTRSTPFRPNNLNILVWKVSFPASSVNRYRVLVLSVIEHGNNSSHHAAATTAIIQINRNKIERFIFAEARRVMKG